MGRPANQKRSVTLADNGASRRSSPWIRFRSNRAACAGVVMVVLIIAPCVLTLPLSYRWHNVQELVSAVRHRPVFLPVVPLAQFERPGQSDNNARIPRQWFAVRWAHRASSWFGHDDLGRSLLFRVLPGLLVSLSVGLAAGAMAVFLGTTWGALAGLMGGRIDQVMMRIVDVLYGLPYILSVVLLKLALTRPLRALLGDSGPVADLILLFLAIGGVGWLSMARVVRGQVLSLKAQPFVEAARAAGAGTAYILVRHLLPNLLGTIVTYGALAIPQGILQESFLSFLGIGVQQPMPSLGRLAADGVEAVNTFVGFWWLIVFPCGALVWMLMAMNFIADGIRDACDPKSQMDVLS